MDKTELRLTCAGGVLLAALAVTAIPANLNTGNEPAIVAATTATLLEGARGVHKSARHTATNSSPTGRYVREVVRVGSPAGRYVLDTVRVGSPKGRYVREIVRAASPSGRYVGDVASVASPVGRYVNDVARIASPEGRYVWVGQRVASPAGRYVEPTEGFARARPPAGRYVTLPVTQHRFQDASLLSATPRISIALNNSR